MRVTKYWMYLLSIVFVMDCSIVYAKGLSSGRWVVWSSNAASAWEDAFVVGNGVQGMMAVNDSASERFICTHEELFIRGWDRRKVAVPKTAHLLPQVRHLMEMRKTDEADELLTGEAERQLREMGALQRWPLIPHPAFDLCVDWEGKERNAFRRQLDLEIGEGKSRWQYTGGFLEESYFSSRTHHVNVVRFKGENGKRLNLLLSLKETPGRDGMHFEHDLANAFKDIKKRGRFGLVDLSCGL